MTTTSGVQGGRPSTHHFVVCRSCGTFEDVGPTAGEAPCLATGGSHGFVIDEAQVIRRGLCPACSRNSRNQD